MLALKENKISGEWERRKLCVGDSEVCPGADSLPPFGLALAQDAGGEVYVIGTFEPGAGGVYQITDPARYNNTSRMYT